MIHRYSWLDIDQQVTNIRIGIKRLELKPDLIVGVTRGGLIPATLLAYDMGLTVRSLQWQRRDLAKECDADQLVDIIIQSKTGVIIVDDVLDSGRTIREIDECVQMYKQDHPDNEYAPVNYAVCVKRTELPSPVPKLIVGEELADFDWVNFPWGD
jgi:hypoxanthine phosphoribosyltransferase